MTVTMNLDPDRILPLTDGQEVLSEQGALWRCSQRDGTWWAHKIDSDEALELNRCPRRSARMLESRYFTAA